MSADLLEKIESGTKAVKDIAEPLKEFGEFKKAHGKTIEVLTTELAKPDRKGLSAIFAQAIDHKEERKCGWPTLGHQLKAIHAAKKGMADQQTVDHLWKTSEFAFGSTRNTEGWVKATQGLGEAVGPDGGFLLAPQYVDGIMEIVHRQAENLLNRCDKYDMASPSMIMRAVDETSRATGSRRGGIQGYWVDEGATINKSKPKFRQILLQPHKLAVLVYATDELIMDGGSMLEQYASRYAAEEINFLASDAIINGTGAGKPLGILNAACTLSVSKETGQFQKTIVTENIVKMWARLHANSRENAVWLINQDTVPQLYTMTLGVGTGGVVTYMPPGGLNDKPYANLMGKPVIEVEYCPTLGTVGDIILADMKAYIAATRGTVQAATSIHVEFLTDQTAYRFTYRVAGQPWWNSALTPFQGTNTQSPFVTLATRS